LRLSREAQQDSIRLKNLVGEAVEGLIQDGLRRPEAEEIVEPASQLPHREEIWGHRSQGMACFCGKDWFRVYTVPLEFDEQLFVSDRFHVKPLLPLLTADARFYVLALSQESARLFEATRHSIRELELPPIPRADVDGVEQVQQHHSHRAPAQGKGKTGEVIFHGQGGPEDRSKTDILHYFQRVNRAVTDVLREQRAPLVLACVGYLAPIYESANSYARLIKAKVPGSPDRWSLDELRRHAWKMVEGELLQEQKRAVQEFKNQQANQRATDNIREVVLAADAGRVGSLLVENGSQQWGRVEPELHTVHLCDGPEEGDEELLDYAVTRTLANDGDVHVLPDIPDTTSPDAAILRD